MIDLVGEIQANFRERRALPFEDFPKKQTREEHIRDVHRTYARHHLKRSIVANRLAHMPVEQAKRATWIALKNNVYTSNDNFPMCRYAVYAFVQSMSDGTWQNADKFFAPLKELVL